MNDAERRALRSTLVDDIAGYDAALAEERNAARKLMLIDRRRAAREMLRTMDAGMEYDELTKMIYEIRSDLAILRNQFAEHTARCQAERSGYSPTWLMLIAVGGMVLVLVLVFALARYMVP